MRMHAFQSSYISECLAAAHTSALGIYPFTWMRQRRRRTRGGVSEKGKEHSSPHCSFFNSSQNTNPETSQWYLIIIHTSSLQEHDWKSTYNRRLFSLSTLWPHLGLFIQLQHSTESQRQCFIKQEHWINHHCTQILCVVKQKLDWQTA